MTEPVSKINSPDARPGRLKGSASVYLHSFYAIRAFQGRAGSKDKPRIYGADEFNSRTNMMFNACKAGDPFAHYALVQVESALEDEERNLTKDIRRVRKFLSKRSSRIKIADAMSDDPVKFVINYANYGFQLVDLLSRFDELCQLLLNASHLNRIKAPKARDWMEKASDQMRHLVSTAGGYRFTNVLREDLVLQTKGAKTGIEKLINTNFLDARQFTGFDDICNYFATYDVALNYGPPIKPIPVEQITNPKAASNGSAPESLADVRATAPGPLKKPVAG